MTKKSIGSTEFAKGIQKYFLTFFQGKKESILSEIRKPDTFLSKNE
jgi:hypothetical protein